MLPRTSPTKAIAGIALISAGRRSPARGERPTTGSDEGNPSRKNFGIVSLFYLTLKARQLKLGKFSSYFGTIEHGCDRVIVKHLA